MLHRWLCATLALLMLLAVCSCGQTAIPDPGTEDPAPTGSRSADATGKQTAGESEKQIELTGPSASVNLLSGYSRAATETGEVNDAFRSAVMSFSFDLLRNTLEEEKEGNKLISPTSALLCLALVANGAAGTTRSQMETAFGMDVDVLNRSLYAWTSRLPDSERARLELANSVWFRNNDANLSVKETFLQTVADWYDAQAYAAPFDDGTVRDVNDWCSQHTDGMIPEILQEIDPATMLILINALVFDAKWETLYEDFQVAPGDFTNADGSTGEVNLLSSTESIFLSGDGIKGVVKPYDGGAYSFVGLLPTDENADIRAFAESLDAGTWATLWQNRRYRQIVRTMIPEFTVEDGNRLAPVLEKMGMTDLFSPERADLTPMATYGRWNLFVSSVYQKTRLELTRYGTKAAAVTWALVDGVTAIEDPKEEHEVYLTRPFVYMIVDNATGLPLFIGVTESLSEGN